MRFLAFVPEQALAPKSIRMPPPSPKAFSDRAHEHARTRTHEESASDDIEPNPPHGHLAQVRIQIGQQTGRQTGVDTATHYLDSLKRGDFRLVLLVGFADRALCIGLLWPTHRTGKAVSAAR